MTANILKASALTPTLLASLQLADTSAHSVYAAPIGGAAIVKHGTLCNVTGAAVIVNVAVVPADSSYDGSHRVINSYSLAANDTLPLGDYLGNCHLGPGDAVYVAAGAANAIDVILTGLEAS